MDLKTVKIKAVCARTCVMCVCCVCALVWALIFVHVFTREFCVKDLARGPLSETRLHLHLPECWT